MKIYLDASVAVSAITNERHSDAVQDWLAGQSSNHILVSAWCLVEVAAALSFKQRTGQISEQFRIEAVSSWRDVILPCVSVLQVDEAAFIAASIIAGASANGLRAGDALHVAICQQGGYVLATLDQSMALAASALGIAVDGIGLLPAAVSPSA